MKTKIVIFVFFLLFTILLYPNTARAEENSSGNSANFAEIIATQKKDHRVTILKKYLESMNSPLSIYAQDFINQADAFNLPWNLVAAISGTESTFGQQVPFDCNNAFGFGIYTNHTMCFNTYSEAIRTVSQSLRQDYIDKYQLKSLEEIGSIYAASPTWSSHTNYFLKKMDDFKIQFENQTLPISL